MCKIILFYSILFYSIIFYSILFYSKQLSFCHKFKFFVLYIFLIIQVRFECFALWNRIPLFFNGQLVSSLSYPGLLVNACITMTLSNKYTNIFESLVF